MATPETSAHDVEEDDTTTDVSCGPVTFLQFYKDSKKSASTQVERVEYLEDFHCFPKLAAELRIMIWKHALPGPRLIDMEAYCGVTYGADSYFILGSLRPGPKMPTLFYVSKEARDVALEAYQLLNIRNSVRGDFYFYVNVSKDTLFFNGFPFEMDNTPHSGQTMVPAFPWSDLKNIRHFAFSMLIYDPTHDTDASILQWKAETVTLVRAGGLEAATERWAQKIIPTERAWLHKWQTFADKRCDLIKAGSLKNEDGDDCKEISIRLASRDGKGGFQPAIGHSEEIMEAADGPQFPEYS